MKNKAKKDKPRIGFAESLTLLVILLAILGYLIIGLKESPQIPILFALTILMFYGKARGFSWDDVMDGIETGIKPGIIPLVIFLMIGVLIAAWIFSGTIPTIMYFGFRIISVKFFLPTVFIVCSLIAICVGSSFTTVSTMGLAFIGISAILKVNPAITAGAVVSGAFFGSNVSPLSGTTNLAAGIGEIDLYEHIKSLIKTDIPAFVIVLLLYTGIGFNTRPAKLTHVASMLSGLKSGFWISAVTLIPVILLIILAWVKVPAVPSLIAGSVVGLIIGFIHNPSISLNTIANYLMMGYKAHSGNPAIDELLSKGGIESMLDSAALIILALAFGGLLIKFQIIESIIDKMKNFVNRPGRLVFLTALSCIGVNLLVGEQYLSVILPGETFKKSFDRLKLPRRAMTRVLNDAGAAVNSIIPWSVSGTFIAGALQVNALKFIPFAFFPIVVVIITIITGFFLKTSE